MSTAYELFNAGPGILVVGAIQDGLSPLSSLKRIKVRGAVITVVITLVKKTFVGFSWSSFPGGLS